MLHVSPADLLAFAPTLHGQTLQTLHQKRPFTVDVEGKDLYVTPSTGKRRLTNGKWLHDTCVAFSTTNSYHPGDYRELTYNASYTLALIRKYADSRN